MISFPPFVLRCRHVHAPIDLYLQSECDFQHVVPPLHGVGLKRQKPCYVCYTCENTFLPPIISTTRLSKLTTYKLLLDGRQYN